MFPNLSMLDVSNNNLKDIPHNINELNNLSVLNISGNVGKCQPLLELEIVLFKLAIHLF